MAWLGVALFLLLIAPVKAGARAQWDERGLRGAVGLMIWGLRAQAEVRAERNGAGRPLLTAAFRGRSLPLPRRKGGARTGLRALALMLKSNGGGTLRRAVKVRALEIELRLGAMDAAALAVMAGLLRAAGGAVPFLHFRCLPVLGGKSALRAVCIAETRLGILLGAAWLWKMRGEKKKMRSAGRAA